MKKNTYRVIGITMVVIGLLFGITRFADLSQGWQNMINILAIMAMAGGLALLTYNDAAGEDAPSKHFMRDGQIFRLLGSVLFNEGTLKFLAELGPGEVYYFSIKVTEDQKKLKGYFTDGYYYRYVKDSLEKLNIGRR